MAELIGTNENPELLQVFTNCSGFITSLFTYANIGGSPPIFVDWNVGSTIPEAGCFNPKSVCNKPSISNYYHLFTSGQRGGFRSVFLEDLKPGDIIAYARTENKNDTGYIMLVTAISSIDADSSSRAVVVIDVVDEKSLHGYYDSREINGVRGIGMGVAKLFSPNNNTLEFFWELNMLPRKLDLLHWGEHCNFLFKYVSLVAWGSLSLQNGISRFH